MNRPIEISTTETGGKEIRIEPGLFHSLLSDYATKIEEFPGSVSLTGDQGKTSE